MSEPVVWLNGRLLPEDEASISIFDRGFTLGDGVFETMRVLDGEPLWVDDHLRRLRDGAEVLGIPVSSGDGVIGQGLSELIAASGHAQASLRLTLTRGPSRVRGLWPPAMPMTPTLLATVSPMSATARPPLNVVVAKAVRRNEHSPLSRIKSLNYGDNILARREAETRGAGDGLLLNGAGRVVCATAGNVFLRIGASWLTPPVADGILAGTARRRLLGLIGAREVSIDASALAQADAAFLSNSLGLTAIRAIEGRELGDIGDFLGGLSLFRCG